MGAYVASPKDDDVDMIDAYLKHLAGGSDDTVALRRKILNLLHKDLPSGVAYTCQQELEDWLYSHKSPNTQATYWVTMHSFYGWATDPRDPWLDEDPTADMTPVRFPKGVARPGSEEQLEVVLSRAANPYRLWTIIAAYQGLRCCEISGLDRKHVTADTLFVVRGKGGKPRVHDTDPLVWDAIRDLPPGPIARTPDGTRQATAAEVSKRANHYFKHTLKLDGVTMHMWRHRLGVQMQRLYKNARVTQEALGHEWLTSTQIYTRADVDELRAARAMLPRPAAESA